MSREDNFYTEKELFTSKLTFVNTYSKEKKENKEEKKEKKENDVKEKKGREPPKNLDDILSTKSCNDVSLCSVIHSSIP